MDPRIDKLLKLPAYQRGLILGGILLLIVAGFIYFLFLPKQEELKTLKQKNETLQAKLLEDQRIANNLPKFKAEYEKMKERLDQALSELPNEKEIPTLLASIATLAKDRGLDVLRFKPGQERPQGFYAEVPVELKLVGSYHQVALFFQDVGDLSRIVNIGNLNVGSAKSNNGLTSLSVDCLATTFRFLEQTQATPPKGKK